MVACTLGQDPSTTTTTAGGGAGTASLLAQPVDISACPWLPKTPLSVCGADGKEYPDLYQACLAGTSVRCLGKCPCWPVPPSPPTDPSQCPGCKGVVCTAIYAPVCCNGKTYPNQCTAKCCGFDEHACTPGACPPADPEPCPGCATVLCPAVYDPVCCNGKTYPNQCRASCCGAQGCTPGACN
jgi:hypothetical protein